MLDQSAPSNKTLNEILDWPRDLKRLVQVLADIILITICYVALLRIWPIHPITEQHIVIWIALVIFSPAMFLVMNVYLSIVRYIQPSIVLRLFFAAFFTILMIYGLDRSLLHTGLPVHLIIDLGLLIIVAALFPRILFVQYIKWRFKLFSKKVAVYGVGEAGLQLKSALDLDGDYRVIAFIDDSQDKQNTLIQGLPVISMNDMSGLIEKGLEEVLLAIPSASHARRKEIINAFEPMGLHIRTIPMLHEILSGTAKLAELREITSEDLLGRDPVPPVADLMVRNVRDKIILVTGAGGTIGAQICREISQLQPRKLVLFEASELALYTIEQEFSALAESSQINVVPILGSVCNEELVSRVLDYHQIDTIFHAAAYKHVPMVEMNPLEGMNNNAIGTWILARAAVNASVTSFVLISTDKAVRSSNIMGASKRVAELCIQAIADATHNNDCRYSIVRFGNVLSSSGSVIPKFRKQIEAGGPVTVTHEEMTRYFMTVTEAAQLVIQAGAMGNKGEVYVLDMGESVNIYDLALRNIRLHGFEPRTPDNPMGEIEVRITGIRPGEKLYEELLIKGAQPTEHPRILKSDEPFLPLTQVEQLISSLKSGLEKGDVNILYSILKSCECIQYQVGISGNDIG